MESKNIQIRELAALNIGSISYNERGKEITIKSESIPILCKMLHDPISKCRWAATRALVSLAQLKEGKVEIYDLDKLNRIIELINDEDPETRVNVFQLISSVAEYPPAWEKFKECLALLKEHTADESNPLGARFAKKAI